MADMTRDTTRDVTREEQLLRSAPLFGGMDIGSARSLMEKMTRSEVSKGDTIFNEGDDGQALYIIVRGKIKLARTARDGRENLLGLLGVGDMLGELSVFDPGPRLARAHQAALPRPRRGHRPRRAVAGIIRLCAAHGRGRNR